MRFWVLGTALACLAVQMPASADPLTVCNAHQQERPDRCACLVERAQNAGIPRAVLEDLVRDRADTASRSDFQAYGRIVVECIDTGMQAALRRKDAPPPTTPKAVGPPSSVVPETVVIPDENETTAELLQAPSFDVSVEAVPLIEGAWERVAMADGVDAVRLGPVGEPRLHIACGDRVILDSMAQIDDALGALALAVDEGRRGTFKSPFALENDMVTWSEAPAGLNAALAAGATVDLLLPDGRLMARYSLSGSAKALRELGCQ